MDLHKRYMNFSTLDFSILELLQTAFKDDPFLLLHRIVRYYNAEFMQHNLDTKKLETFRMVLCYEYQLLFNTEHRQSRTVPKDICFQKIADVLISKEKSEFCIKDLAILYDIVLLHIILYCDSKCLHQYLERLHKLLSPAFLNHEIKICYMKFIECLMESIHLRQFLYNDLDPFSFEIFETLLLVDLLFWLEMKEDKEWHSFASYFPKIVNTFGCGSTVYSTWNFVITKMADIKDSFAALSIMIDTCLRPNLQNITELHYELCYTQQLWVLIIDGIRSSIQQYRKQALFVMKRVVDFMDKLSKNDSNIIKPVVVPFVCNRSVKTEFSMKNIQTNFFLVLEALEEKQYHLVAPALSHVLGLINSNQEHTSCGDCFNIIWIQLIFERILQHENHAIVKQGILYVCKLDVLMTSCTFLQLFVNVLNNTSLYECQSSEDKPGILIDIAALFERVAHKNADFMTKLLTIISKESWGPVPIFYMMQILRMVSTESSISWTSNELNIVKSLVQKNLNMHSCILRIASQIELLQTISNYTSNIKDLTVLVNTLAQFSSNEALTRGSYSWNAITKWLSKTLPEVDAINFVKIICYKYVDHYNPSPGHLYIHPEVSLKNFASAIFMLSDAGLIFHDKTIIAENALNNFLSLLSAIDVRPYVDTTAGIETMSFMLMLLNLNMKQTNNSIVRLLSLHIDGCLRFLLKGMKSIPYKCDNELYLIMYMDIIVSFLDNGELFMSKKELLSYIEKFLNESIAILENKSQYESMHYLCGLHILQYCQGVLNTCTPFCAQLLKHLQNIQIREGNNVIMVGEMSSCCYILLAKISYQYITNVPMQDWPQEIDWLQNTSYLYEMGGLEVVTVIASILKVLLEKGAVNDSNKESIFESIFSTCWRFTILNNRNQRFFAEIKELIGVIVNNSFLKLPNAMNFIQQFLDEFLAEGDKTPKLKKILLSEMELLDISYLPSLQKPLLTCLLHGYAPRKDKKIENQACSFIAKNYGQHYPKHVSIMDYNSDAAVRAQSVLLLYKIITLNSEYASTLLPTVLEILEKYKDKRYFNHSYIHRIKHRIMQILLLLQPILNETDTVTVLEVLRSLMLVESNQHSVRLMQEWILIRIFTKYSTYHYKLWEFFEEGIKTRPGCTSSIASIVYHVAQLLPGDSKCQFIDTGLKYITRCCLGQQFNMRLYNQIIFVKLHELLQTMNCDQLTSPYKGLYNAAIESLKEESFIKNSSRIQDDFYLTTFHPMNNYSLQTLYFELPRLSDMDTDELISTDLFKMLNFKESENHPLHLYDMNSVLSNIKTSSYLTKTATVDTESLTNLDGLSDIQKKINPSESVQNIFTTARETISHQKMLSADEGIIVVASLIDRIPNLGGIARTCEIFNVKELIISNLSHVKAKEFQSLSVSAEKWITITEVKPYHLQEYMLEKKSMGWSLVGAEQTANSTNLLEMKFNKKTILVLGNEKDGIPANLIPLFDTCVEIPQMGVIRSLNVHVTGAICIWQYVKEHMLT